MKRPNKGYRVEGNKTLLSRPSRLRSKHVRFSMIALKPAVAEALEGFLYEWNDEDTRSSVRANLGAMLADFKSKNGCEEYQITCDTSNNSSVDIDNNVLNVDLYVRPKGVAERINYRTIITPSTISFDLAADLI